MDTKKEPKIFLENKWFAIGFIILVSFVVYYNSLNAPFIFDDSSKIIKNPDIKQLSNIKTKLIYRYKEHNFKRNDPSRPLLYLTFTLNYHFGKLNPFTYHLFNMLMHVLNGILIFLLIKKIIFYVYGKDSVIPPFFTALLFAVHPINTSVVTYICGRSDVLVTFFYILSLLFFIKSFEKNRKLYIFSLLSFILAIFSKQIAVTLPAIILIFDYIFLSNFEIGKVAKKKYYHMGYWIVLFLYLLFRVFCLGGIGDLEAKFTWDRYSYLIVQPYVLLRYLMLLIVPAGLCINHSVEQIEALLGLKIPISFSFIIAIFVLVYRISRKKTNASKIVLFSALWFFIILSPTSSFFPTTNALVENRLYLSGLGVYLIIVYIYFVIFHKGELWSHRISWTLFVFIALHIFTLGIAAVKRNQLYQNPVLMWQDVISKYPKGYIGHLNLGVLYKCQKEDTKAIQEYKKVVELHPDYFEAHSNLAVLYHEQGKYSKALEEYQRVLETKPDDADTHYRLGHLWCDQEEYVKAIQEFQKALEINTNYTLAHYNLGVVYQCQKEYIKAIREFRKEIDINPNCAEAHNNLGVVYCNQKEHVKAIQEFQKVLEINPEHAGVHKNLGVLYKGQKEYKKALKEFECFLKLNPYDENVKAEIRILKGLIE